MVERIFTTILCLFALVVPALAQQPGGLSITQTGPSAFSGPGFLTYNRFNITNRTYDSATDWRSMGLYLHSSVGGPWQAGAYYGLFSQMLHDQNSASGGDHAALVGQSTSIASDTSGGEIYGGNMVSECSGCVALGINGLESDVGIDSGGTTQRRTAIRATNQADATATQLDTAYSITSTNAGGSFQHAFTLSNQFGAFPIQPNGDVFYADAPGTIGNFANLPNLRITGYVFNFPNFKVYWNGVVWLTATVTLPQHYVDLPVCTQGWFGTEAVIYDASSANWGDIISTGGGENHAKLFCDGKYWTVTGR